MSSKAKNKREIDRFKTTVTRFMKVLSGNYGVTAGWYADQKYDWGTSIAEVARFQEYGGITEAPAFDERGKLEIPLREIDVPPRPFMRPALDNNRQRWVKMIERGIVKELKTNNPDIVKVLDLVGLDMRREIKHAIEAVHTPPLAWITIARRRNLWAKEGRNTGDKAKLEKPLIDTGTMITSVTSKAYGNNGKG